MTEQTYPFEGVILETRERSKEPMGPSMYGIHVEVSDGAKRAISSRDYPDVVYADGKLTTFEALRPGCHVRFERVEKATRITILYEPA